MRFRPSIPRAAWDRMPCRVERNVNAILDMLDEHEVHATFFMLGWVAERYPVLARRIVERGHELASHGYGHQLVTTLTRDEFSDDVSHAKRLLEDVAGVSVCGYRAPSFSIGKGNLWALECLAQAGYRYSSSIYPFQSDHYGMPDAPRFAHYPCRRVRAAGAAADDRPALQPQPAGGRRGLFPAVARMASRAGA
jgi:polysaccharide deacetylase family protein (PEP-CTERM system associated)